MLKFLMLGQIAIVADSGFSLAKLVHSLFNDEA